MVDPMPAPLRLFLATAPRRTWGRIAAWATVVFGILQVLVLPLPVVKTGAGWEFWPSTLVFWAATALLAWGAFRDRWIAFIVLALLGAVRLLWLALAAAHLIGDPHEMQAPVVELIPLLVTLPFAVAWIGALVDAWVARRRMASSHQP